MINCFRVILKENTKTFRLYTSEGARLRSYKTAAEYMMQDSKYTQVPFLPKQNNKYNVLHNCLCIKSYIKVVCPQDDISRLYLYPDGKENSAAKQNLAAISNEIKLKSVKKEPGCDVMAEQQV